MVVVFLHFHIEPWRCLDGVRAELGQDYSKVRARLGLGGGQLD